MIVKIKKLVEEAVIPTYNHETDAGMDLVAVNKFSIGEDYVHYGTGLSIEIPKGYVGLLFPRSSVSKYDLQLCNSVGVVDSGYLGEVSLRFNVVKNEPLETNIFGTSTVQRENKIYNVGDKIGQLIVLPFPKVVWELVEEFEQSERGENGFGSSGN